MTSGCPRSSRRPPAILCAAITWPSSDHAKSIYGGSFLFRCLQAKPVRVQLELAENGVTRFGYPKADIGAMTLPIPPLPRNAPSLTTWTGRRRGWMGWWRRRSACWGYWRRSGKHSSPAPSPRPRPPRPPPRLRHPLARRDSGALVNPLVEVRHSQPSTGPSALSSTLRNTHRGSSGCESLAPSSGRICADDRVSVDEATAERLVIHRLSPCDVVFARRGELGRCGVVEPSQAGWLCGMGSLRARLRLDMVDPYYIVLVFTGDSSVRRAHLRIGRFDEGQPQHGNTRIMSVWSATAN